MKAALNRSNLTKSPVTDNWSTDRRWRGYWETESGKRKLKEMIEVVFWQDEVKQQIAWETLNYLLLI